VFDWLFEGWLSVYLVLATAAVFLLFLLWTKRQRRYAYALGAVGVLAAGYWLLDVLVETDREEIARSVREIAAGIQQKDTEAIFRHVSDGFSLPSGMDKAALRRFADLFFSRVAIQKAVVWDFQFEDVSRRDRTAKVSFHVKIEGDLPGAADNVPFACEAVYRLDPDGRWRLGSFRLFHPTSNEEIPLHY